MTDINEERQSLYNRGFSDAQIARIQGVDRSAIGQWRKRHQLASKWNGISRAQAMLTRGRKFLYNLQWSDNGIAEQQGVSVPGVRAWRITHGLPANRPSKPRRRKDRIAQIRELQDRVVHAIGSKLPMDIAADAAADLMVAVVDGTVPVSDIEKAAKTYRGKVLQEYANGHLTRSLDETVGEDGNLTRLDMLKDESFDDWLDEMGATRH